MLFLLFFKNLNALELEIPVLDIFYGLFNFLLLLFLAYFFLRKPVSRFLLDRRKSYVHKKKDIRDVYLKSLKEMDNFLDKKNKINEDSENLKFKIEEDFKKEVNGINKNINKKIKISKDRTEELLKEDREKIFKKLTFFLLNNVVDKAEKTISKRKNTKYIRNIKEL